MTIVENRYLDGNFAPVHEEVDRRRPAGHRHDPRRARRAATCATARTRSTPSRPRDLPLVHRRRHGARRAPRATARPSGTATAGCAPATWPRRSASRDPGGASRRHGLRREHQRDRPRRQDVRHRRGRRSPSSSTYELDTLRPRATSTARCPAGSPPTPKRDPETGELHAVVVLLGLGQPGAVHRSSTPTARCAKVVPIETTGAARCCTTWRSPSATRRALRPAGRRSTSSWRWAASRSRTAGTTTYPRPCRAAPPRRRRRRRAVVRDRALLRLPPAERLRRRRPTSCSTSVRHPKMFATELNGPNEGPPTLDRWTIDPAERQGRRGALDDRGQEFPRLDERLIGQPHRYGYACSARRRARRRLGDPQARPRRRDHGGARLRRRRARAGAGVRARATTTRPRTTAGSWPTSTTRDRPQRPRDPRRAGLRRRPRRHGPPPAAVSPSGSTATGCPTRLTLTLLALDRLVACQAPRTAGPAAAQTVAARSRSPRRATWRPTRSMRTTGSSSWRRAQVAAR